MLALQLQLQLRLTLAVNPKLSFAIVAVGLLLLVLAVLLHAVWRGAALQPAAAGGGSRPWLITAVLLLGLPAVAVGFYSWRGDFAAVGAEPAALSEQLLQQGWPAAGEPADRLYAEVQRHLKLQPADTRALVIKARLDMQNERYALAVLAFEQALAGRSKVANDASVWVEYAEARGMLQGRTLLGEPQRLLSKALELDGRHPQALDLAGSAAWEARNYEDAARYWQRLLAQLPGSSPRRLELSQAIERAQRQALWALPQRP